MSDDTTDDTRDVLPVRRRVLQWFGGLGVVGFFAALLAPAKDLGIAAAGGEDTELPGQALVLAEEYTPAGGSESFAVGETVTTDMLGDPPESVLTYPENLVDNNEYLVRLQNLETDRIAAPTNLEWVEEGLVAYSAVCTHLGCTVGWEEEDDQPPNVSTELQQGASMLCPCHISSFDPYKGAEVLGGPASRPVPQIGVGVRDSGAVELTTEFEGEVGSG